MMRDFARTSQPPCTASVHGIARPALGSRTPQNPLPMLNILSSVSVRESRIQYLCDPQWFMDTASRITDSACKNQLVVVSVQYGPFNPYIPIRSTTIGKSRVAIDPIAMHTSWRSNSDIASVTSLRAGVHRWLAVLAVCGLLDRVAIEAAVIKSSGGSFPCGRRDDVGDSAPNIHKQIAVYFFTAFYI
ncbi:hypothetical protein F511_26035 [Dorcoceras hygrometricum]|uniref:Uncharacterized protein n=1 Tax=Dorcoceras hygrometricum TaxID=472368 RepID=A0A2Z7AXB7_9LAMI|nr:hypothetical protein F511_26035 [Dorcoceras hygrometricum]